VTYDTERVRVGRKPVLLCEIDLDKCANIYGAAPESDIDEIIYGGDRFALLPHQQSGVGSIAFNNDFSKMFMLDGNDEILDFELSTPGVVSTATAIGNSVDIQPQSIAHVSLWFNDDGTKFYTATGIPGDIFEYSLSVGFDLSSTFAYVDKLTQSVEASCTGGCFSADGTKLYLCGRTNDKIHQFSCSPAFDVSTATSDAVSIDFSSKTSLSNEVRISDNGLTIYVADNTSIFQYDLSTAWSLTGATFNSERDLSTDLLDDQLVGFFLFDPGDIFIIEHYTPFYVSHYGGLAGNNPVNELSAPEDFSDAAWTSAAPPVVTADTDYAPDGAKTADLVNDDNAAAHEFLDQDAAEYDDAEPYSFTIFVKKDTVGRATRFIGFYLTHYGIGTQDTILKIDTATGEYDLTTVTDGDSVGEVQDHSADWWQIVMGSKSDGSNTGLRVRGYTALGASATWVNGVAAIGSAVLWGAQLTKGAVPVSYGVGICTALGVTGSECYNTRETCQDLVNFNPILPKTYQLSSALVEGEPFIPCINSSELAPTVINPDKGLGLRASIKVTFDDFPHHDIGIDPYYATRNYTPADTGTYFGKLIARNRHYVGRPMRIKTGYIGDTFSSDDFQTRSYVIDKITGPNSRGQITIEGKDILKLADDARAVAPAVSTGKLTANITSGATSLTVTSGTESEYDISDYLRIGDEVILAPAANRSSNVFSNLTRGSFGSVAASHDADDTAQACKHLNATNPVDVVYDLLINHASIPTRYITTADWDTERDTWYTTGGISTLITESEGVTGLINDLAEQFFFQLWWDDINQKIIFKAIVPPRSAAAVTDLSDADSLVDGSVQVTRDDAKRLSRVIVYYNPISPIDTSEAKDYRSFYARIDSDSEASTEYGDQRQKIIFARFIGSEATAIQTGGRVLSYFRDSPRDIKFKVDAKDSDNVTGGLVDIISRAIQGTDGADLSTRFQITSVKELTRDGSGHHYEMNGIESQYNNRYGYIGATSLSDYSAESDANKALYGFICLDTGLFADGTAGYRII